ncbi:hypothetical protein HSIVP1_1319 [Veillonella parvula HSIVP1]|nr:hypothetical protein HSIVP1_1319 [Veillonella parvula HSIVP1]
MQLTTIDSIRRSSGNTTCCYISNGPFHACLAYTYGRCWVNTCKVMYSPVNSCRRCRHSCCCFRTCTQCYSTFIIYLCIITESHSIFRCYGSIVPENHSSISGNIGITTYCIRTIGCNTILIAECTRHITLNSTGSNSCNFILVSTCTTAVCFRRGHNSSGTDSISCTNSIRLIAVNRILRTNSSRLFPGFRTVFHI